MRIQRGLFSLTPGKIASLYAAFGLLWISTSDVLVLQFWSSEQTISAIQTIKGGAFVALSGALIWGLTDRRERQLRESRNRLESVTQRLQVLQRVFRHNIRNDLNVIQGYIDLYREDAVEGNLDRLDVASAKVTDIIDISEKLKVLDRYEVGESIGAIDLVEIIDEEVASFEAAYPEATIETDLPAEAVVKGDSSLQYVVAELFENAAEHYDDATETLQVRLSVSSTHDGVEVRIEDNGPGIYEGELDALRTGRESALVHVSSVGLWLVYWLCERVDGTIEIESAPGEGTEVRLRFKPPGTGPAVGVGESDIAEINR